MEAKDLRIGNYVLMGCNAASVMEIYGFGNVVAITIEDFKYHNGTGLEPIPLTEEWLLKFGFKKLFDDYDGDQDWCSDIIVPFSYICKETMEMKSSDGLQIQLKSVHQLQNLYFALTGEELQLKES